MTALVVFDTTNHDVARYVRVKDEKLTKTHEGFVNDDFIGSRRSLQEFLHRPPEPLRVAKEPYDAWRPLQDALRTMEEYDAAHLGDV